MRRKKILLPGVWSTLQIYLCLNQVNIARKISLLLNIFLKSLLKLLKKDAVYFPHPPLYSTLVTIRRLLFKIGVYLLEYGEQEINEDEEMLSWKQPLPNIYLSRTFEAFMYIEFLMIF